MAKRVRFKIGGSGAMLVSLLFSAAVLPVVLMGTLNPEGLNFMTKADGPNEVRVWMEPSEIVTKPGASFDLDVMADFESETLIIPKLSLSIRHDTSIVVSPEKIEYRDPFRGLVKIGSINVRIDKEGKFELEPDAASVFLELPDVSVVSAKTLITSKK